MKLFMESTKIDAERTALEIQALLRQAGARKVMQEYKPNGDIDSVTFVMEITEGVEAPFRVPCRVDPIFNIFQHRRDAWKRETYEDFDMNKAERVAWRQVLRWLQAQVAFIETEMVEIQEVFMPYLVLPNQKTLYRELADQKFNTVPLLEAK